MNTKETITTTQILNDDSKNVHFLSVSHSEEGCRLSVSFLTGCAKWLPDMGFVSGALVQALPLADSGMVLNLRDKNIKSYSGLDTATRELGGKLIKVHYRQKEKNRECLELSITGEFITRAGLASGDALIARYGPGIIQIRKCPDNIEVTHVLSIRDQNSSRYTSRLRLYSEWLQISGFTVGKLVTVLSSPGSLTFEASGEGIEKYDDLVRLARKNKMKLIQVSERLYKKKKYPCITMTGLSLSAVGFDVGEPLLASFEYGRIKLQKFDFAKVGF